ncbi:hypothetical protein [Ureibacillus aquaedulcis]|uniref:Uncharacterized protein n=1 Tax=Ureibacillus aquaedulcis TaxID=3058421 RepID=A0ABT8GN92_9BACL|nr:hypothetical protein [Ureibacillus sp. BA0131]MDN4492888.1 hypothetical protein [Ureibacillus sp. BA0131]
MSEITLDHALIDIIGLKRFYTLYKRVYVYECKQAGLSQGQTLIKINNELTSQGQKTISLSLVKNLW